MMLILRNLTETKVTTQIQIRGLIPKRLTEQFSSETLTVEHSLNDSLFDVTLNPKEVKIYCG